VTLAEAARGLRHLPRIACCGRDQERLVVRRLLRGCRSRRVIDRPARRLLARGAARARLVRAAERLLGALGAAVDLARGARVEEGVVDVVRLERLPGQLGRLAAERLGALGPEPADGARDLGRVLRAGLALEGGGVARQRLALGGGEAVVVPQVHGRGDEAVDGASGEQKGVHGRRERGAGEDAERPDGVVHDRGAAVVAVVGEETLRRGRVVHLEAVLGEAADQRVGVRVEDILERLAAGVARGREAGGEVADVVGEARRREAAVASFLVTPLQVGDVAGERVRVALEAVHGDQPDALLERRLGAGLLAEEIGRAPRRGERQCEAEQDRGGADHR
jgi:hypothetical protein